MEEKNYYILVYDNSLYVNFEVIKIDITQNPLAKKDKNLCFIIECLFHEKTNSQMNSYYMNYLRNDKNIKIKDNTINWKGLKCKIIELERWDVIIKPNFQGLALKTLITDMLGNELKVNFDNSSHDGSAFKKLFTYLTELNQFSTHRSVEVIRYKNHQIEKLKMTK